MIKMLLLSEKSLATDLERSRLHQLGISVSVVAGAELAVSTLLRKKIDLIMINVDHLGLDNSIALCEQIRADSQLASLPIITNSAQTRHDNHERLKKAGSSLIIEEALPKQYLISQIKHLLQQDSRQDERVETLPYIRVALNNGVRTYPLNIINISVTGLLAEISESLPLGKECHLAISFARTANPMQVVGKTVRVMDARPSAGKEGIFCIGIKFMAFEGEGKELLQKHLESLSVEDSNMLFYL